MRKADLAKKFVLISAAIGCAFFFGAKHIGAAPDFFKDKVQPIFEQNCVGCHGAKIQRSGLDLRTEESVLKGGTRGASVVPGQPEKSLLYKLVTHKEEPAMPMGGKLSDAEIAVIAEWIKALQSKAVAAAAPESAPVRAPGYSITDKDRSFWSFVSPVRPTVPKVKMRSWVKNEIDAFVLAKLESKGLRPSPAAEPRELLRRVYFDLIGLPPSPEEMAEFLKNPSEAAYQKAVEKLLASQHYGERWGRHWLDLARYADSGGYEFDYDRPHAWRYRDWVIRAINADMPYDQFIREQLAGDQLKPAAETKPEDLIATGFVRSGPTVDNANNEQTRSDELDDMVSTTSSVFLGLTVGCARCHDHKYDPIPQKDYYRMQAVFFPYEKAEKLLVGDDEKKAHAAANKAVDERLKPYRAKIAAVEKRVREKLMSEKVEFHVKLAEDAGSINAETREAYRKETAERFAKAVNIQPEEIDEQMTDEERAARKVVQKEIDEINKTRPKLLPAVMGVTDEEKPKQAFLLRRGDIALKGDPVNPGLPQVVCGETDLNPLSRRKQLADWISSKDNPLTARVAVNRIWQYHFGKGIVRTPSDFGATGDKPSHPELLDWLATELMAKGWSWKAMHRLILTSNAYRQSSKFNEKSSAADLENHLLWRANPRRMEAEVIRDSMLSISGKLNKEMFGPGIYPRIDPDIINTGSRPRWPLDAKDDHSTWRRSVYIFVKRSVLLPMIEVFDCPATTVPGPVRAVSTVSPQALALMNNEFVLQQAGYFAERVAAEAGADARKQIASAFKLALNRQPSEKELTWASEFLQKQAAGYAERKNEKPSAAALRDLCHAIFNLNEFLYLD
ncbi:MAG: PSD1 and planctomycete cytochrome C domain-containing protein [Blastocatellia bacterium]